MSSQDMVEDVGSGETNMPRRLEESDDCVTYLLALDKQLAAASATNSFQDSMESIVDNVLTEINTRTASAACDRRTNSIVEKVRVHNDNDNEYDNEYYYD